jgi:hypothetical protein
MDEVTRKRMHNRLTDEFDKVVEAIEGTDLTPAEADHPVCLVRLNGEEFEIRLVLKRYDGGEIFGEED